MSVGEKADWIAATVQSFAGCPLSPFRPIKLFSEAPLIVDKHGNLREVDQSRGRKPKQRMTPYDAQYKRLTDWLSAEYERQVGRPKRRLGTGYKSHEAAITAVMRELFLSGTPAHRLVSAYESKAALDGLFCPTSRQLRRIKSANF